MNRWLHDPIHFVVVGTLAVSAVLAILALIRPPDMLIAGTPMVEMRAGQPEYCNYASPIADNIRLRFTFTPHAALDPSNNPIDPNQAWAHGQNLETMVGGDFVTIPAIDYELSTNAGQSWTTFWHQVYETPDDWPRCMGFGHHDALNFWVWQGSGSAITQDGGQTWLIQSHQDTESEITRITSIYFKSPSEGQLVFQSGSSRITTDGGATWYGGSAS